MYMCKLRALGEKSVEEGQVIVSLCIYIYI